MTATNDSKTVTTSIHANGKIIGQVSTREISAGHFEWVVILQGKHPVNGTGTRAEMNAAIMAAL